MNNRINERIPAHRVRLILPNGENKGEMLKSAAIELARQYGLDLVEMAPGTVPVCKIIDYGKLMYDRSKAERHQQHQPSLKEMRIGYNIGDHDLEIKKRKIQEFLAGGHKVLFSMQVRGREKFVARGAAKEKFVSIVQSLVPTAKPSDIQDNGGGYSITLHPQSK